MVKCNCGKEIQSVPNWLQDVKVNFVCNNCPNRDLLGITEVDFSIKPPEEADTTAGKHSDADEADFAEDDEEEAD